MFIFAFVREIPKNAVKSLLNW